MTQIGRMAHGRLNLTASTFNQLVAGATATQISPEVSKNEVSTYLTTETACKRIKPGCCIRTGITVIDLSADPTAYRWVYHRVHDTRTPDPRLPSAPQRITAIWLVLNYTAG